MDPITISIILAALAAVTSVGGTIYSNYQQKKRDEAADQRALENQQILMDYQNKLAEDTNTIATQKGHMAEAGFSPALMYGNGTIPGLVDRNASGQGTSSQVNVPEIFNKIAPNNVVEAVQTKRYQDMQQQKFASEVLLNQKQGFLADARAAEQLRQTGLLKRMDKTIVDQMTADLALTRASEKNLSFLTNRGEQLLPGELESQGLINEETRKKMNKIDSDIRRNSWEMRLLQADIKRINEVTKLTGEQTSYTAAETKGVIESTKNSALGRIMREYGLTTRKTMPALRDFQNNIQFQNQIRGAINQLKVLGFSDQEAVSAALYYIAQDPKDVSPSLVNGVSRIISTAIKH